MRLTNLSRILLQTTRSVQKNKEKRFTVKKELRRFLLISISIFIVLSTKAETYYVSNSIGDNSNPGTLEAPWKTLDRVNSQTFLPGDQILFKRGDVWTGTVVLKNSVSGGNQIVYSDYGTGDKPVIKGSTEVTGWTQYSGNIYKAKLTTRTNQVFVDGVKLELSKSTESDPISWYSITSVTNTTTFTSNSLKGTDWTDAVVIIGLRDWSYQTRRVISCNPSTGQLTLESPTDGYSIAAGMGFFIMNNTSLMKAGEWSYAESDSTLYIWTPTGDSPANHMVEASTLDYGFEGTLLNNITISNLTIKGFNKAGVDIYSINGIGGFSNNVIVNNCDIIDNYRTGINFGTFRTNGLGLNTVGAINCAVTNCNISGSSERGVAMWIGSDHSTGGGTISNNAITDIGVINGLGLDGLLSTPNAIYSYALNSIISYNAVSNVGANGIVWTRPSTIIEYNTVSACDMVFHDGGGIYTHHTVTGSIIRNNIVYNIGSDGGHLDHGIYIDDTSDGMTIADNTVFGCKNGRGIYLHAVKNTIVRRNTLYNNDEQLYANTDAVVVTENNIVENNIFYSLLNSQTTALYGTTTWADSLWNLHANGYYNPQTLSPVSNNTTKFSLAAWELYANEDSPVGFNTLIPYYTLDSITSSQYLSNGTFDSDISGWSMSTATWNTTHLDTCIGVTIGSGSYSEMNKAAFGIEDNSTYRLSFDVITEGDNMYGYYTLNNQTMGYYIADGTRRHYEFFIEIGALNTLWMNTRVYGTVGSMVYFDNFELYKVDATYTEPTEKSKLFVNDTKSLKSFSLSGTYKDLDGNIVTGRIYLQPFTSKILIKQDDSVPVNQSPTIKGQSFNIEEIKESGDFVGQVVASDPDAGQTLTYSIVSGNEGSFFFINSANGELSANQTIQFSKDTTVVLTVKVTDNATSPLSAEATVTINILATEQSDTSIPIISSFSIPSTSTSLTVPVTNFIASDNTGVTGYILTESSTPPEVGIGDWTSNVPTSYTFSESGTHTLYAWVADAAGNISASVVATVTITVESSSSLIYVSEDVSICDGESYLGWTDAGQYERTLKTLDGTDSIVTTNLYVNPVYNIVEDITIKEGENYLGLTSSGVYSRTLTSALGCDSTVTTNLIVLQTIYTVENIAICEGESYQGLTNSGQYERTLIAESGADSIVTTNLTVNPVYHVSEDVSISEGENYLGWTVSGDYERTLTSISGCDSIITTYLSVGQQDIFTSEEISICDGESYLGWTTSGEYERTLKSAGGADSIVTTSLVVNPVYDIVEDVAIIEGESYLGWSVTGSYMRTLTSETGCDSTITTNLTVLHATNTIEEISICEGESYLSWTVAGIYERTLQSSIGVDSVVTTILVVNPVYNLSENITIKEGESYQGWTTSGTYSRTLSSATGCDSTVTTYLTVLQFIYSVEEVTICEGESYLGLSTSGEYERILTAQDGSDSIVTTILYVNPVYHITEEVTINEGESYLDWTVSGQYERTLSSVSGCDSIVITNLTVTTSSPISTSVSHSIDLKRGWNVFSSYVLPDGLNMDDVLHDLTASGALVEVIDEDGNTYEQSLKSSQAVWINNIGDFSEEEGYKILVSTSCNLQLLGEKVTLPLSISLKAGWNIISFPSTESVDAMDVVQPLIDLGVLIKVQNEKGKSLEYWSKRNQWINSIGYFTPGEGYLVNVTQDCQLTISDSYPKNSILMSEEESLTYFSLDYQGNGHNHMNLLVDLSQSDLEAGDELAAFDGDICVGAVKLADWNLNNVFVGLVASKIDDGENNGFTNGNPITLKVWRNSEAKEFPVQATVLSGDLMFEEWSSSLIQLSKDILLNDITMYPNPATSNVNLQFSALPELDTEIILTDLAGKILQVRNVQSTLESIDVQSYPSGIYLVNVVYGNTSKVFKLVKR